MIERVTERSGYGIFLAALSGALCFLPMILTGFRGVMEMGLVTGIGIIFTLIATFTVLPALSICTEGKSPKMPSPRVFPTRVDLFCLKPGQARFILASAAFISMLGIWSAFRVYFDPNPLRLQSANAESVIWEKNLLENAERSPLFAAAFGFSPEEVLAKSNALEKLPSVGQVESVFSLLPADQEEKLPLVHSLSRRMPAMKPVALEDRRDDSEEFIDVLERIRFKMQDDQAGLWGAEKPLVEQMTHVRGLIQDIIKRLSLAS